MLVMFSLCLLWDNFIVLHLSPMHLKVSKFADKFPFFSYAYLEDGFALCGCGNNLVYYLLYTLKCCAA